MKRFHSQTGAAEPAGRRGTSLEGQQHASPSQGGGLGGGILMPQGLAAQFDVTGPHMLIPGTPSEAANTDHSSRLYDSHRGPLVSAMKPMESPYFAALNSYGGRPMMAHASHPLHGPATKGAGCHDFPMPPDGLSSAGISVQAGLNGASVKRARVVDPAITGLGLAQTLQGGAHQDALMELARENLLLKHQLHVATLEMSRLTSVLNGFEQGREEEPKQQQTAKQHAQSRYWTDQEHQRFLEAVQNFGHKDVKAIANVVGTRSATQVRTHAQKYFMKMARFKKQEEKDSTSIVDSNPDAAPSEMAEDDNCTGTAAAAAAAAGEAGTSAAAAAAFVAASHGKQGSVSKQQHKSSSNKPAAMEGTAKQQHSVARVNFSSKPPGSPGSMDSGRSGGSDRSSEGTSNGRSNGVSSNDTTNGNGSSSSHSNRNGNEGSCSDSGRGVDSNGDSNNGVSSNEGSDHGFFDTGAEEEDAFVDDLQFQHNGDDNAKTGFEFAESTAA